MAKKETYFLDAEKMYVEDRIPITGISKRIGVSEKTLREWRDEGEWENKKKNYLKTQNSCNIELYKLVLKLTQKVNDDIDQGIMPEAGTLYTIKSLTSSLPKMKSYEDSRIQDEICDHKDGKVSTEDIISKVNDILGVR